MLASFPKMQPPSFVSCITIIIYLFQLTHLKSQIAPSQIPKTVTKFSVSDDNKLQRLAVHQHSGDVYLGAHNRILKFNANLSLQSEQNWLTAGVTATPCPPENQNCESEMNDNKVLVIDYENNFLLSCGSSHYGTCVLHGLDSVSNIEGRIMSNLANDSIAVGETVVAYFGQFRSFEGTSNVLYIASTYENNPPSTSIVQHAVASKTLSQSQDGQWQLKLAYEDFVYGRYTYTDLRDDDVKQNFKIKYVYGFSIPGNPGFSYFLTVQRDDLDQRDYKSKIIRICQEDKGYFSYTEMTLRCKSSTNEFFPLLQAAYLGKAGNNLINSMSKTDPDDDVLYAVFSRSESADSREPAGGSAVCAYPMPKLNDRIVSGLQDCFYGSGTRGLKHIERSEDRSDCVDLEFRVIGNDFCGTSQLHPIDTGRTYTTVDLLRGGGEGQIFTSIAVKPDEDETIAIIGTESGHLLKFLLQPEEEETGHAGIPYKNLLLDGPVLQDMAFDPNQEHVYAMTPETIYKFSLSTCDHYIECSACILTHDPNQCGWCGSGCAMREECEEEGGSWVTQFCPPVIFEVIPSSAPLNTPVTVTLVGDNLGTGLGTGQGVHEFTVAGKPCAIQPESDAKRIVCTVEPVSSHLAGPVVAHVEAASVDPVYRVNGTYTGFTFSFVEPSFDGFRPTFGPIAGGTNLTLLGTGLNAGNSKTVTVAGQPCLIRSSNSSTLICTTTESVDVTNGIVELTIDNKRYASTVEFTYMLPPTVKTYSPSSSYISGGRLLVVNGGDLHVVAQPKIAISFEGGQQMQTVEGTCNQADPPGNVMVCPSPNITAEESGASAAQPITGSVSFIFDGWYSTPVEIGPDIVYYADPVFNILPADVKVSRGNTLIIEGSNLDVASNASEITVMVRDKECEVTKLTQTSLHCKVPALEYTIYENEDGLVVTVNIGNFMTEVGRVHYDTTSSSLNVPALIIAIVFLLLTGIVVAIVVYVFRYRQKKKKNRKTSSVNGSILTHEQAVAYARSISVSGSQHSGSQFSGEARVVPPMSPLRNPYARNPSSESRVEESRPLLQQIGNDLAAQVSEVLINESNVRLGETIGQGHFGCVYEGMFLQDGEELHVAVKSLLHGATSDISSFLKEGIMMKDFKHRNVLRLIGVCIKEDRIPLVVLPFMKHGDLLTYIRNPQNELTARQLLQFSRDIADGMGYLASLKFVHRDLAARNCMLDEEFVVKVADFGLSRDIYERDYYSAKDKSAKLPVRWMALECLERNIYNTKTDVWSYGIVMWELMTRGVTPYPSVDNCDLSSFLQRGRRLPQPPHCPDNVFDVMNSCWLVAPVDRPHFTQLVAQLDDILNCDDEAARFDKDDDLYINVPHL